MSEYRNHNLVRKGKFKRRLEFESSGVSHVQDSVLKTLYENEIDLIGEYTGVVLNRLSSETTLSDLAYSAIKDWAGFDKDRRFYKIRVEPVHDMIPMPEGPNDCLPINMHHTFSEPIEFGESDLTVGDIVVVSFIDGSGVFNPRIVSRTPKKDATIANWTTKGTVLQQEIKSPLANITRPRGDDIGSGTKCMTNQIPKVFNKVEEDKYSGDSVLRWLPMIRGVRNTLKESTGTNFDHIKDATMLAMIDIESKGQTGLGKDTSIRWNQAKTNKVRSQFYSILQQRDDFVYGAYEFSPGNKVGSPFAASNYINFTGHPNQKDGTKVHQPRGNKKQNEIRNFLDSATPLEFGSFEEASAKAIQTAFLAWNRYPDKEKSGIDSQQYIAMAQKGGPGFAKQTAKEYKKNGGDLKAAILKFADQSHVNYAFTNFPSKYNKYVQKLGEYDPDAAEINLSECEPEFVGPTQDEFIGPVQTGNVLAGASQEIPQTTTEERETTDEVLQRLITDFKGRGFDDFNLEDAKFVAPFLVKGGQVQYDKMNKATENITDFTTFKPRFPDGSAYTKSNLFKRIIEGSNARNPTNNHRRERNN